MNTEKKQIRTERQGISWWWGATLIAGGLFLGIGLLGLVYQLARPLALLILAIAIATALSPVVNRLDKRMPRTLATILVYLVLGLIFTGLGWVVIPDLISQGGEFVTRVPAVIDLVQGWLTSYDIIDEGEVVNQLLTRLGSIAGTLVSLPLTIFSSLLDILLILFVSLYWVIVSPSMMNFVLSLFPEGRHQRVQGVLKRMGEAMGGYVRGTALNGIIVGVLTYIGLLIIGIDYALVLGIIAGLLEVVPIVGPLIAGILIVATGLLQSPTQALIAGVYVLIMQQLESNVLVPNIMRSQTDISPLLVIIAIFLGSSLGGLVGALAAIPFVAAVRVLVKFVVAPAVRRSMGADPKPEVEVSVE